MKNAAVSLRLLADGQAHRLLHVANTFVIAPDCTLPPGTQATIRITVDDRVREREVVLPDGADPGKKARWVAP